MMSDYLRDNNLDQLDARTTIIVSGYSRNISSLFSTIPYEVESIILSYIHDHFMLHRGWYEWHINSALLHAMLVCENEDDFLSNKFKMTGLNWQFKVYPNGNDQDSVGSFNLFLSLLSKPSSWKSVTISYRLCCYETKSTFSAITTYHDICNELGWPNDCLLLQDINDLHLNKLTLFVFIQILRINLKENNQLLYQYPIQYIPEKIQKIQWQIDDNLMNEMKIARIDHGFMSPLFHNMWCLKVYPKGVDSDNNLAIELVLCALPMDEERIKVHWKVICDELDIIKNYTDDFDEEDSNCHYDILPFDDFKKFDSFTFHVEICGKEENEDDILTRIQWEQYVKPVQKLSEDKWEVVMSKIKEISDKLEQQHKRLDVLYEKTQNIASISFNAMNDGYKYECVVALFIFLIGIFLGSWLS